MPIYRHINYTVCCDQCGYVTRSGPSGLRHNFERWLRQTGWIKVGREWLYYDCSKRREAKAKAAHEQSGER